MAQALSVQNHQKVIEIGQNLEGSQVEALRQAKAACKGTHTCWNAGRRSFTTGQDYMGLEDKLLEL